MEYLPPLRIVSQRHQVAFVALVRLLYCLLDGAAFGMDCAVVAELDLAALARSRKPGVRNVGVAIAGQTAGHFHHADLVLRGEPREHGDAACIVAQMAAKLGNLSADPNGCAQARDGAVAHGHVHVRHAADRAKRRVDAICLQLAAAHWVRDAVGHARCHKSRNGRRPGREHLPVLDNVHVPRFFVLCARAAALDCLADAHVVAWRLHGRRGQRKCGRLRGSACYPYSGTDMHGTPALA